MNQQITREDTRSLLARAGLSVSDERLDGLTAGFQAVRAAAASLASLELGFRGPAPFQPPRPADGS